MNRDASCKVCDKKGSSSKMCTCTCTVVPVRREGGPRTDRPLQPESPRTHADIHSRGRLLVQSGRPVLPASQNQNQKPEMGEHSAMYKSGRPLRPGQHWRDGTGAQFHSQTRPVWTATHHRRFCPTPQQLKQPQKSVCTFISGDRK